MSVQRFTAVWLTAIVAVAVLSPVAAEATHQTGWQDGGAAVSPSVDFAEVAAFPASGVVVAVGKDTTSGNARIFRRVLAGTWVEDTVTLPAGATSSSLVDVDLTETAAWAVGTYVDTLSATHPLTLRIGGGQPALSTAAPATWSPTAETLADGATPTAVAVRGTDGLLAATVGTDGKVFPFHDDPADCTTPPAANCIDAAVAPQAPTPPAGPINAIALHTDDMAFTAGELQPGGGTDRIYRIDLTAPEAAKMLPVGSLASAPNLPMAGIGADSATDAVAVEANPAANQDPGTWSPSGGVWTRDGSSIPFTSASKPNDLSLEKVNTTLVQAVAGTHPHPSGGGLGAVWRRNDASTWTRDDPPGGEALTGVAVFTDEDMWAVGDDGTVLHFAPLSDTAPPNTFIDSGPPEDGTTSDPTPTFGFSSDVPEATFECSVDGAPLLSCTSPKTIGAPPLELGPHTFAVKATAPGGVDTATREFAVVEPDTTIVDGPAGPTADTTPTFSFTSELDSATFQCAVDSGAFASCTSPKTTDDLNEGFHTFHVRAVSEADVVDPSPASRSFFVDLPDPVPCVEVPRPLIRDVVVRKVGGALLISFAVAAPARVRAKAYHGDKLIGRTKEKVFKPGATRTLRLRWHGDLKPTRLKMSAKPAAANAC